MKSEHADQERVQPALPTEASVNSEVQHDFRFWLVFVALSLSVSIVALELATVSTALPTIIADLGGGASFIWVGSAYALCTTAIIPFMGGLAEIMGRRPVMMMSLIIMAAGSAICGSSKTMGVMIGGRVIQGIGAGGVMSLNVIIIADLVPLQDRGKYNAIVSIPWSICNSIAPIISGAATRAGQWRWLFYLNVPVVAPAVILFALFLRVPTPPGTLREKVAKVDWIGNALVIGGSVSTVLGLTWGGVTYAWSSVHVLAPLILGPVILAVFVVYEAKWAKHPVMPFDVMKSRTGASGYAQIFTTGFVMMVLVYYMPVYFQAAQGKPVMTAGIDMLPFALVAVPLGSVAAISVKSTQTYRPQLWIAWILLTLGSGLMIMTRSDSPTSYMLGFASFASMGLGILITTLYFPVLAPLELSQNAPALALFMFLRNFAQVWGISIGGAILQNALAKRLPDEVLQFVPAEAAGALQYAVIPVIDTLPPALQAQVRQAFGDSLVQVWIMAAAVSGLGLVASLPMRSLRLHTTVDEKWAYKTGQEETSDADSDDIEKVAVASGGTR